MGRFVNENRASSEVRQNSLRNQMKQSRESESGHDASAKKVKNSKYQTFKGEL